MCGSPSTSISYNLSVTLLRHTSGCLASPHSLLVLVPPLLYPSQHIPGWATVTVLDPRSITTMVVTGGLTNCLFRLTRADFGDGAAGSKEEAGPMSSAANWLRREETGEWGLGLRKELKLVAQHGESCCAKRSAVP